MDPINIIAALNLVATFGANLSGAKKGLKATLTAPKEKPKTYLQKIPIIISTLSLIAFILAIFQVGTLPYTEQNFHIRVAGLLLFLVFSWIQVWSFKALGNSYSQDVIIFKNHELITRGPYRVIRHPQYTAQILMDLGAGLLTLGYVVLLLVLIEIPLLILRASLEEKLLEKHFTDTYKNYKKKSGSFIPFLG